MYIILQGGSTRWGWLGGSSSKIYTGVEICEVNCPIGEFDGIDLEKGVFYEYKTAKGLNTENPSKKMREQTPQQFADKQIYTKTANRINNLNNKATGTRATVNGSQTVPSLDDIKSIKKFVFRLEGDSPELRSAVQTSMNQLQKEFPDYSFSAEFGVK